MSIIQSEVTSSLREISPESKDRDEQKQADANLFLGAERITP
ncbi:hypothetical protein M595_6006 [Lyngbya aestuarii BL J]|uniref:Uncharacterized protein n=1 Tax=Lyngbya aestuarii BL J TaxID=1348334 RepID=U7QAK2_9CYAN|nr:hypothetical protein M595_6006 [Lyngbya aestuarii BL J]